MWLDERRRHLAKTRLIRQKYTLTDIKCYTILHQLTAFIGLKNYIPTSFFFIGELHGGTLPYWQLDHQMSLSLAFLQPSRVDPEVQGLKVVIDCPQPGSSQVTYRPPPVSRWSKCRGNETVTVLLGSAVQARCTKKLSRSDLTQSNSGEQAPYI